MARSVDEIKALMIAKKEATSELADLDSSNLLALWNLVLYVCAFIIHTLEKLQDVFRASTDDKLSKQRVGNLYWYAKKAREFRDGIALNWVEAKEAFEYPDPLPNEDLSAQMIVTHSAVVEVPDKLRIKVATTDGNGLLQPLESDEADRVLFYMKKVRWAGTNIEIVNLAPDELKVEGVVIYDPLLISPDGSLVSDASVNPLEDAMYDYVNIQNDKDFNGDFVITDFIDALQDVSGITNPAIIGIKARYGNLPFEDVDISYLPNAGYLRIVDVNIEYRVA